MWQAIQDELAADGLTVLSVALDSGGAEAAGPWIRRAEPSYPVLIDTEHRVAALYGITNVPSAVWIDEEGMIVRPAETAGATDAWRFTDRATGKLPDEQRERQRAARAAYQDALRDWVHKGSASRFAHPRPRARPSAVDAGRIEAVLRFELGLALFEDDHRDDAVEQFAAARALWPDNWVFARQGWELEEAGKAGGPEFRAAVQALGDRFFYVPPDLPEG